MIKTYMPNALMRALTDIAKVHPADNAVPELASQELKDLISRIEACPEANLEPLAFSLLKKEIIALCRYICLNRFHIDLNKVLLIINLRMEPAYYRELFLQWQKFPQNRFLLRLLAEHDQEQNRGPWLQVPSGYFDRWMSSADIPSAVNLYVMKNSGHKFEDKYTVSGFSIRYPLFEECLAQYLTECGLDQLEEEGDSLIVQAAKRAGTETAELILINLLLCGNNARKRIVLFENCFELMFSMWKEPDSGRFPKNQNNAFAVYFWWYNYVEVSKGFLLDADPRRKDFWANYLDKCEVSRIKKHRMVIFTFEHFCAVEFEVVGRTYLFERQYFKAAVLPYSVNHTTADLKSWLWNTSQSLHGDSHSGRWEGRLAYELRKYI